jgi:Ni/Co efflux regulator RcnB
VTAVTAGQILLIYREDRSSEVTNMFKRISVTLSLFALLLVAQAATAAEAGIQITFSDREISVIRAYYSEQHVQPVAKGKGKGQKSLPPGIAKNLQRGKSLPPGIAKQVLPTGLVDLLPPPPGGYERIEVAGKVLLVEIATQVIHDVLEALILG